MGYLLHLYLPTFTVQLVHPCTAMLAHLWNRSKAQASMLQFFENTFLIELNLWVPEHAVGPQKAAQDVQTQDLSCLAVLSIILDQTRKVTSSSSTPSCFSSAGFSLQSHFPASMDWNEAGIYLFRFLIAAESAKKYVWPYQVSSSLAMKSLLSAKSNVECLKQTGANYKLFLFGCHPLNRQK